MRANKIAMFFYICTLDAIITLEAFSGNLQKTYKPNKKLTIHTQNPQKIQLNDNLIRIFTLVKTNLLVVRKKKTLSTKSKKFTKSKKSIPREKR